jgi:hypothetical protein
MLFSLIDVIQFNNNTILINRIGDTIYLKLHFNANIYWLFNKNKFIMRHEKKKNNIKHNLYDNIF